MSPLFKRREKVDIQIVKVEPLQASDATQQPPAPGDESPSGVVINIVGKQQLREQFSDQELLQVAEEFAQMAVPEIVQKARQARKSHKIDDAILMLRQYVHRLGTRSEIEAELLECRKSLDDNAYFQLVANGQLATVLFDAAGFRITEQEPVRNVQGQALIETRLTVECIEPNLRNTLEIITRSPQRYDCYCLAEFEQSLDDLILAIIQEDHKAKNRVHAVNRIVHFVVCKDSSPKTNMMISVNRFAEGFITVPLERREMQRAITLGTETGYLQSKISAWVDNHRLFATTLPVTRAGEFFGRENDVKQITGAVQNGESFCILGGRRMGKTSLIQHLASLGAFRAHLHALLDLEGYMDQPNFDRAAADLLQRWSDDLQRKYPSLAKSLLSQIPTRATSQERLTAFLRQIKDAQNQGQLETSVYCLAVLDDLNLIMRPLENGSSLWERGAAQLVRLLRRQEGIVVTGLTMWDFETRDIVESTKSGSGLGNYKAIYLRPLSREECDRMITYIGGIINMEFELEGLDEIYLETGGHPFWTRLICDAVSSIRRSSYEHLKVSRAHVRQAANEFMSRDKRFLVELIESLPGAEQRILRDMGRQPDQPFPPSDHSSHDVLDHLKSYGLVDELSSQPGQYRLRMGLLARLLQP